MTHNNWALVNTWMRQNGIADHYGGFLFAWHTINAYSNLQANLPKQWISFFPYNNIGRYPILLGGYLGSLDLTLNQAIIRTQFTEKTLYFRNITIYNRSFLGNYVFSVNNPILLMF